MTMATIEAGGINLHVEDTGSGRPIVFVHEFAADCRGWEPQIRYFSRAYRCIAYNARGYPPSDVPEDAALYGWEFSANDIAAVMQALGIERAHVVGLSMGAYAALQFGLRFPEKADAIVAAGVGSGSPPSARAGWKEQSTALARGFIERGMAAMAQEIATLPNRAQLKCKNPRGWLEFVDHLSQQSPRGMTNTMARYLALRPSLHDFRDQFSRMTIPVLLAVGDEDEPCIETNLMLKSALPNAGLWICPNAGHAINLEEPAAFNAQAAEFFSDVERGSWRRNCASRAAGS
jgi:pimeloyl-ACP methyl ester carboxylesterase